MAKIIIEKESCKGCALCVRECPKKILKISDVSNLSGYFVAEIIDESLCIGCANCAIICPDCAIEVQK